MQRLSPSYRVDLTMDVFGTSEIEQKVIADRRIDKHCIKTQSLLSWERKIYKKKIIKKRRKSCISYLKCAINSPKKKSVKTHFILVRSL